MMTRMMSRSSTGCCVLALMLIVLVVCEISMATPWRPPYETSDGREEDEGLSFIKRVMQPNKQCRWQAELCSPHVDPCCAGLKCSNYQGGYCLSRLQSCICYPQKSSDM